MTQQDFVCPSQMHNNPKQKNGKIQFLFVNHKQYHHLCTLSYFSHFFSIFVLQVSYCLNISRGQMFWWWGRRDIWKRVGIFNLFFFGRKKKFSFYLLLGCPHKKEQKWAVFSKSHLQKLWHDEALIMGPPSSSMGVLGLFSIFNVLWARKLVYDLE